MIHTDNTHTHMLTYNHTIIHMGARKEGRKRGPTRHESNRGPNPLNPKPMKASSVCACTHTYIQYAHASTHTNAHKNNEPNEDGTEMGQKIATAQPATDTTTDFI
jgi:hypothetical protein